MAKTWCCHSVLHGFGCQAKSIRNAKLYREGSEDPKACCYIFRMNQESIWVQFRNNLSLAAMAFSFNYHLLQLRI